MYNYLSHFLYMISFIIASTFDISGPGQLCALDLLSSTGLLNYFGRNNNLKEVNISPILLEKGTAKLAIFGLSAIKDERLFRLFKENRVSITLKFECA